MITASHNDESYNGVKISDPSGGMLAPDGEQMAVGLARETSAAAALDWIVQHCDTRNGVGAKTTAVVHVGRDTRSHSLTYRNCLVDMIVAAGGCVVDHGVCTTPMLHHAVLHDTSFGNNFVTYLPSLIPPRPNVAGYLELLASSYLALCATADATVSSASLLPPPLVVDCACGVGFPALVQLVDTLQSLGLPGDGQNKIVARNAPGEGPLNEQCGSEHVQKAQMPPVWYAGQPACTTYCAALDGDSDRIVFFAQNDSYTTTSSSNNNNDFLLLDGDKISCLFCQFIQEQLATLEPHLQSSSAANSGCSIRLGVVQTAYANGASTRVLQELVGVDNVLIAKTGVKHVHEAAHHHFDIGVYFEANGHGTILFGPNFYQAVALVEARLAQHRESASVAPEVAAAAVALKRLQLLPALVNQAVGDALSDLLLVDAILTLQGRSLQDWYSMYQDLPSRQSKVKVPDRNLIKTNQNETKCIAPVGLQQDLDEAMLAVNGRAFVRPSGTEDVVRVYAEAPTQEAADALAHKAEEIVQRMTSPSKI